MQIEIRLKRILQEHGLHEHGIVQQIASELKLHRHTIGKLYRNELTNPSLKVLSDVSDWLQDHGVPPDKLPHALWGRRPSALWQAIGVPGRVTIYLGEYQATGHAHPASRWISRRDAAVQAMIIKRLSTPSETNGASPELTVKYVPLRFVGDAPAPEENKVKEYTDGAERVFRQMRSGQPPHTSILVGSQRTNYLVELLVADLFGCRPFCERRGRPRIPFYLAYRDHDRSVPSCFGGHGRVPGYKRTVVPGIYYLDPDGQWVSCPWEEDEKDAGVVITVYDPGARTLEMGVVGFSGRGTESIGLQLLRRDDAFWPPAVETKGRRVGVSVCQLVVAEGESVQLKNCDIVGIDAALLKKLLA